MSYRILENTRLIAALEILEKEIGTRTTHDKFTKSIVYLDKEISGDMEKKFSRLLEF